MAWYICEMALYHKDFVSTKPSVMARASMALARGILGRPDNADLDHTENVTVLTLSQRLQSTSQILSRKYSSAHLSRASTRLEQFLAQQAAIQTCAAPPTPPCEVQKPTTNIDYVYNTPVKAPYANTVNNGYLTPPITPDGEFFLNGEAKGYSAHIRRPITPTPQSNNPYAQRYSQPQFQAYSQDMMH